MAEPQPQEELSHYDISYRWQRGSETGWTTIGRAFPNEDGSIGVKFDAMPIPGLAANPGDYRLFPKTKAQKKADKAAKVAEQQQAAKRQTE